MGNASSTPGVDPADAEVRRSRRSMESTRACRTVVPPPRHTATLPRRPIRAPLTRVSPPSDPQKSSSPGHQLSFDIAYEVVKHADVQDAARAACACKSLYALRDADQLWWRPSCEALGARARLYVPRTEAGGPIHGGTWKEHFFHLWAARDRWGEPAPSEREWVRDRFRRLLEDGDAVGLVGAVEDDSDDAPTDAGAGTSATTAPPAAPVGGVQVERGSVKVIVRMRPRGAGGAARADGEARGRGAVVLPLHQRLRIIKAQRGEGCTTSDAMRTLMRDSGRGAEASRSPWADAEVSDSDGGSVAVHEAMREAGGTALAPSRDTPRALKDVTNDEKESDGSRRDQTKGSANADRLDPTAGFEFACGVLSVDERERRVLAVAPGVGLREFAFDAVFGETATQAAVYERSAQPLVADFVNGFNGAMLVYGQTGSGKTHTMFGPSSPCSSFDGGPETETLGIVPRACEEILSAVRRRATKAGGGVGWALQASYVEVFGQDVFDLLAGGARVGQSRVASRRYVADGDTSVDVRTAEDIARILKTGDAQKRRAATAMNDRSSRAHAVFSLTLTQTVETLETPGESPGESRQMRSRLCLVDLGGSEKLSKSRANEGARGAGTVPWAEYYASRARVTEATNINVGLLALKRCVDALHEAQRRRREGIEPPPHVPYSDSKLTELLSDALGGDGKTAVLVACAPEHEHAVETAQSLRFGERCASVETRARVGRDALAGMLALLDAKIGDCEARIELVERWVTTTTTRRDEIDGTDERVVVSKLAGAEGLRVELEAMLAERAFLTNRIADAAGTETRRAAPRGDARVPSPKPERATARDAADEL